MARDIAQHIQSWLPTTPATDPTSQQRILELETELAKLKATQGDTSSPPGPPGTSIQRALHGNSSSVRLFGLAVLLVTPGTVNPWLEENQPPSFSDTCYKK